MKVSFIYLLNIVHRHPACFASLNINGCELGLSNTTQGRKISENSDEMEHIMIRMDSFVGFIESKHFNINHTEIFALHLLTI